MRTLTVSLSQRQVGRIQEAVESGSYASNSEVIRDALRLWEQREEVRALELAQLKRAYDEGKASGTPRAVDAETLLAEFKGKSAARG
ncbi:MAG: type II toxin-antitoxin system ParD family antitoxin [Rhodoplanes sp.]|uniref:type II toxin-antitoxin system ParD family antitoxin n=1 Tax=Rhodoplanes sp. TaxID=1968906 RepID=UPI0017EF4E56|nr:type II toxin-antitoxin system ParD family antitoxin [Rhodoplanes sp.]NVO13267.1 type II toxin-antitoxin system ParD family antitoxin [Rhodoplanes sp.]